MFLSMLQGHMKFGVDDALRARTKALLSICMRDL